MRKSSLSTRPYAPMLHIRCGWKGGRESLLLARYTMVTDGAGADVFPSHGYGGLAPNGRVSLYHAGVVRQKEAV